MARVTIFLIIIALIAGTMACAPARYSLTISSTEGGSVTSPGEGTFTYDHGTVVELVATPGEGYRFVNWTGDVGGIADVEHATTSLTMNESYSITASFEQDHEVRFADANLEAAIREAIGKPTGPIYGSDLDWLTCLYAYDRGIADLTGLGYCTHLTQAWLRGNQIGDVSPLARLTRLTWLDLGWNLQIGEISALANLTSLRGLWIGFSQISDISSLASLTRLITLALWGNQIRDISALAGLTSLTSLDLGRNQISDISALAGLTDLTGLDLGDNQISDISALAGLTKLARLNLQYNQISDISALAGLANLTWLYLENNQISDISPLVNNLGLSQGDTLRLSNNPLSSTSIDTYIPQLQARGVSVYY